VKCIKRKVAVQGLSLGGRLPNMGWEETSENRCAPTESYTSQIGLYREDIASYTETTTQALEQHGMVDGIESCAQIE